MVPSSLCRALVLALAALAVTTWGTPSRAGDAPAHASAMVGAAIEAANEPQFVHGVGAPMADATTLQGQFLIPQLGSQACAYSTSASFGDGSCPYASVNGLAVNEPDDWQCADPRQPRALSAANASGGSVVGLYLTKQLAAVSSEIGSMVCNWSHFTGNPGIPSLPNAVSTAAMVKAWADEIPATIEANGAVANPTDGHWSCDVPTWLVYYQHVANGIHYVQDAQSEHHGLGNKVCTPADVVPFWSANPLSFHDLRTCRGWVAQTVLDVTGADPPSWCDEAVVAQDGQAARASGLPVTLNPKMIAVVSACGMQPLACMGFERTLRHHCKLADNPTKTLECSGPPNDHGVATDKYCEGEIHPGGGQDFIAAATAASVLVIDEAAKRWADVCKEPDDPCVPQQCDAWCKRTTLPDETKPPVAGFCTNAAADAECVLHTCSCLPASACGAANGPCCTTGAACNDAALECGGETGTCVPMGQQTCTEVVLTADATHIPPSGTASLTASITGISDSSGYSFQWSNTATEGTLALPGATGDCSSSPHATYQQTGAITSAAVDTVQVQVFQGAGCHGSALGRGTVDIHAVLGIKLAATVSPIDEGGATTLVASVPGVTDLSDYSFSWGGTLSNGILSITGCSTSTSVTYQQQGSPATPPQDTIVVTGYDAPGCQGPSFGSASATVLINLEEAPDGGAATCPPGHRSILSGTVSDPGNTHVPQGFPCQGATVTVNSGQNILAMGTTDLCGHFSVTNFPEYTSNLTLVVSLGAGEDHPRAHAPRLLRGQRPREHPSPRSIVLPGPGRDVVRVRVLLGFVRRKQRVQVVGRCELGGHGRGAPTLREVDDD